MYIAVVIALLFYIISSVMDYVISYVGTQRGVADEGNGIITGLFGQKPSLLQYLLYALGEAVVLSLPALLFLITKPYGVCGLLATYGTMSVKHVIAYMQWKKLGA